MGKEKLNALKTRVKNHQPMGIECLSGEGG